MVSFLLFYISLHLSRVMNTQPICMYVYKQLFVYIMEFYCFIQHIKID